MPHAHATIADAAAMTAYAFARRGGDLSPLLPSERAITTMTFQPFIVTCIYFVADDRQRRRVAQLWLAENVTWHRYHATPR